MNAEGTTQHFQHLFLFLPRNYWGSSVPWTESLSHTDSELPPAFLASARSKHQQRDKPVPVSVLCEKHPKETEEFFGLLGMKELAERRKGGRVEVQKSTKFK